MPSTNLHCRPFSIGLLKGAAARQYMKTCESCGRVRFYSLNFIFSKTVCNECYLAMQERKKR
jgi:hypothetical protein